MIKRAVDGMSKTSIQPISVALKTASAMCGYSEKSLRRAIKDGKLSAIRATAKIVIMVADLTCFLEGNKFTGPEVAKPVNKKFAVPKLDRLGQGKTNKQTRGGA